MGARARARLVLAVAGELVAPRPRAVAVAGPGGVVVAFGRVESEDAAEERLEGGGAGGDDADVELEAGGEGC